MNKIMLNMNQLIIYIYIYYDISKSNMLINDFFYVWKMINYMFTLIFNSLKLKA